MIVRPFVSLLLNHREDVQLLMSLWCFSGLECPGSANSVLPISRASKTAQVCLHEPRLQVNAGVREFQENSTSRTTFSFVLIGALLTIQADEEVQG